MAKFLAPKGKNAESQPNQPISRGLGDRAAANCGYRDTVQTPIAGPLFAADVVSVNRSVVEVDTARNDRVVPAFQIPLAWLKLFATEFKTVTPFKASTRFDSIGGVPGNCCVVNK